MTAIIVTAPGPWHHHAHGGGAVMASWDQGITAYGPEIQRLYQL